MYKYHFLIPKTNRTSKPIGCFSFSNTSLTNLINSLSISFL